LKRLVFFYLMFSFIKICTGQIITPPKEYSACDYDGDGFVNIPFSELQNFALEVLSEFNESPEIYVTKAHRGIEKIVDLYGNPQVVPVCGDSDGAGGYYDIAFNSQKEIFITRKNGLLQKVNPENCVYQTIGQVHANGQTVLALSFDHLDHLYEGGWTSKVHRSDPDDIGNFYLWHDFGSGNASGDFVQIGDYMYVAWTMNDGKDHLLKVTLGQNNAYVSHQDMGAIETGTFGLAAEYGRLYGNTVDFLYEINLENMERTVVKYRPEGSNANQWWGAAGYHEALNIQISYHQNLQDAENGNNPLEDPFTNQTAYQDDYIYIRVHESTNNTTYIIPVHIIINIAPEANESSLTECRNTESGTAEFDLNEAILSINPNPLVNIRFFNDLEDLHNNQNPLPQFITLSESKIIYAKVDMGTEDCYGITELELNIPEANVQYENQLVFCKGTAAVLSVPDVFVSYQWSGLSGEDLNQPIDTHEVTISQPGNYSVTVSDSNGCIFILPFETVNGGSPEITNVVINADQSVTVQVSPSGNYEYSLNGILWQSSPVFYGLQPNDYEFFVRDYTGCYSEKFDFTFFIVPNFISPNGDGINDQWTVRGMSQFPDANIQIFDRYGKIFVNRKINSAEILWDGRYMGNPVPSGTYWYILSLNETHKISGHINVRNN